MGLINLIMADHNYRRSRGALSPEEASLLYEGSPNLRDSRPPHNQCDVAPSGLRKTRKSISPGAVPQAAESLDERGDHDRTVTEITPLTVL